jgi:hypothetical protein
MTGTITTATKRAIRFRVPVPVFRQPSVDVLEKSEDDPDQRLGESTRVAEEQGGYRRKEEDSQRRPRRRNA